MICITDLYVCLDIVNFIVDFTSVLCKDVKIPFYDLKTANFEVHVTQET